MANNVITGLSRLLSDQSIASKYPGKIGYLCHSASIDDQYQIGIIGLKKVFGDRLTKIFAPQHGLVSDVQDNMIESSHAQHPYFDLPVYSLYSETRQPTDEMLEGLDHIFVDLQDVGTRIYTYIYTMTLLMKACRDKAIQVIVLDRPNPIDGLTIEGNMLDENFTSFVGLHPMPVRHGLTIAEVALMAKTYWHIDCQLDIIAMQGWERNMSFEDTGLPWVLPSPNLPTVDTAYTFPATVLYEGTNMSEGRGTTRSLEIIGHPAIEPYAMIKAINEKLEATDLKGFILRPVVFEPTFQKHEKTTCGGYQIHPTDRSTFSPWKLGQVLCQFFYHALGDQFAWKQPPYEYEYEKLPIDMINGTDQLRLWVENNGSYAELLALESKNQEDFMAKRKEILLY